MHVLSMLRKAALVAATGLGLALWSSLQARYSMRGNRLGGSCFPFPVRPLWRLATLAELATLATLATLVYPRYLGRYPPAPNHAITRGEIPKSR